MNELTQAKLWAKHELLRHDLTPWTHYRLMQLLDAIQGLENDAPCDGDTTAIHTDRPKLQIIPNGNDNG